MARPQLDHQQEALHRALHDLDPQLARMYLGALWAQQHPENPEWMHQAAHSAREVMNAIMKIKQIQGPEKLGDRVNVLRDRIGNHIMPPVECQESSACEAGPTIQRVFGALAEFFEWHRNHRPTRRTRIHQVINDLDPIEHDIPHPLADKVAKRWLKLVDWFNSICHHGRDAEPEEFRQKWEHLELYLINRLSPRVTDEWRSLDRMIDEVEDNV